MYAEVDVAWCTSTLHVSFNEFARMWQIAKGKFFFFEENFVYFYFAPFLCKNSLKFCSCFDGRLAWVWVGEGPIQIHYYNLNLNLPGSKSLLMVLEREKYKGKEAHSRMSWNNDFSWFIIYLRNALNHDFTRRNNGTAVSTELRQKEKEKVGN